MVLFVFKFCSVCNFGKFIKFGLGMILYKRKDLSIPLLNGFCLGYPGRGSGFSWSGVN